MKMIINSLSLINKNTNKCKYNFKNKLNTINTSIINTTTKSITYKNNNYTNSLFSFNNNKKLYINYYNNNNYVIKDNNKNKQNLIYYYSKKSMVETTTENKDMFAKTTYQNFTYEFDKEDTLQSKYGINPMIVSNTDPELRYKTNWVNLINLNQEVDKVIKARVRIERTKGKGKRAFLTLRDGLDTAQCILSVEEGKVSAQMVKFASSIPHESLVDITGLVVKTENKVESCTVQDFEIQLQTIHVVVSCKPVLPFQMLDANRKGDINAEDKEEIKLESTLLKKDKKDMSKEEKKAAKEEEKRLKELEKEKAKEAIVVKSNTRFDNRVLDLRVGSTQSLMKIQSGVGLLFREYLSKQGFTEIHSPKIIAGASEGGTNVFKLNYFGNEACLAQSPQLYKQMCLIGGIEKVFEIAPVFRAENSNTGRHLCEFTMMDLEFVFKEHYFEILDVINDTFVYIFDGLKERYKHELNIVANQYPFELIEYKKELLKLTFHEGVALLKENGITQDVNEDLDTENERILGQLVKKKYGTDFYILHKYPKSARPFYTMPCPEDSNFTNSYDAFIRGEEILSGAQRIHDYKMLYDKVVEAKINPKTLEDYLESFKLGAPPHGGCGIGLERIVKLFTGLTNVKRCCLFPRDPKRLAP